MRPPSRHRSPALLALAGGLAVTACGESPTGAAATRHAPPSQQQVDRIAARLPYTRYVCRVSERVTGGPHAYRYGRLPVHFAPSALAPDGAVAVYRIVQRSADGATIEGAANCLIPRTTESVAVMDRYVAALRAGGAAGRSSSSSSSSSSSRATADLRPRMALSAIDTAAAADTIADGYLLPPVYVIRRPDPMWGGGGGMCDYDPGNFACYSSGPDFGGGDGGGWDPGIPPTCDPLFDTSCEQPLTETDLQTIDAAIARYVRSPSAIPDSVARRHCEEMLYQFQLLRVSGALYRGATDTRAGDPNEVPPHSAAWSPFTQHMHFEPSALAAAEGGEAAAYWQRDLANSGLHEAAHALRYTHTEPVPSPWGPQYAEEPFKYLSPGENSCIDWS